MRKQPGNYCRIVGHIWPQVSIHVGPSSSVLIFQSYYVGVRSSLAYTFIGVRFVGVRFVDVRFVDVRFFRVHFVGVRFVGIRFVVARFVGIRAI